MKKPIKLDPDKPCPICGGVVWGLEDRIICGWCGKEALNEKTTDTGRGRI